MLQVFGLYLMVCSREVSFGVAYGDVNPFQGFLGDLPPRLLTYADINLARLALIAPLGGKPIMVG
jgi:hypothetical protein